MHCCGQDHSLSNHNMMSIELDKIFDKMHDGLAIRKVEMESAVENMYQFKNLERFLLARGYFKTVRGMLEIYVKKGEKQ